MKTNKQLHDYDSVEPSPSLSANSITSVTVNDSEQQSNAMSKIPINSVPVIIHTSYNDSTTFETSLELKSIIPDTDGEVTRHKFKKNRDLASSMNPNNGLVGSPSQNKLNFELVPMLNYFHNKITLSNQKRDESPMKRLLNLNAASNFKNRITLIKKPKIIDGTERCTNKEAKSATHNCHKELNQPFGYDNLCNNRIAIGGGSFEPTMECSTPIKSQHKTIENGIAKKFGSPETSSHCESGSEYDQGGLIKFRGEYKLHLLTPPADATFIDSDFESLDPDNCEVVSVRDLMMSSGSSTHTNMLNSSPTMDLCMQEMKKKLLLKPLELDKTSDLDATIVNVPPKTPDQGTLNCMKFSFRKPKDGHVKLNKSCKHLKKGNQTTKSIRLFSSGKKNKWKVTEETSKRKVRLVFENSEQGRSSSPDCSRLPPLGGRGLGCLPLLVDDMFQKHLCLETADYKDFSFVCEPSHSDTEDDGIFTSSQIDSQNISPDSSIELHAPLVPTFKITPPPVLQRDYVADEIKVANVVTLRRSISDPNCKLNHSIRDINCVMNGKSTVLMDIKNVVNQETIRYKQQQEINVVSDFIIFEIIIDDINQSQVTFFRSGVAFILFDLNSYEEFLISSKIFRCTLLH